MILHNAKDFSNLKSCWKRAERFAKKGKWKYDEKEPIAIAWANVKMFLEAHEGDYAEQIHFLDWFAIKLDKYSETHILEGDERVAAILYKWKQFMFFDPSKIKDK